MGALFGGGSKGDGGAAAAAAAQAAAQQAAQAAAQEAEKKKQQEAAEAKRQRDQAYGARGQKLSEASVNRNAYAGGSSLGSSDYSILNVKLG